MLIDMHAHTSGISRCCKAEAEEILKTAKSVGIDGLILTNHYQECYLTSTPAEFAERYIAEYRKAEEAAGRLGVKLYFGVEVTAKQYNNAHILLYGIQPEFVREFPDVYEYSLCKMHSLVHERGGLVLQAHPFRGGGRILDLAYLDGLEINCHPAYDATHAETLLKIAQEAGVFVTCGGDYHADVPYRAVCGTHFPDDACEYADLIRHLKTSKEIRVHVHELRCPEHSDKALVRGL